MQSRARQGALLREGLRVVLAGQPNVGKSSLLNALAGAELAIVTPIPGTTRDKVSETIQIDGVPVHVIDTAGLRDSAADDVERLGMARSWAEIEQADAVIMLRDLTRLGQIGYDQADAAIAARLGDPARVLQVFNKCDAVEAVKAPAASPGAPAAFIVSAKLGEGLQTLREELLRRAGWQATTDGLFIARERHLQALAQTHGHLLAAQAHAAARDTALDLFAEELRLAQWALGSITGETSADDLLGEIFGRFCIGK